MNEFDNLKPEDLDSIDSQLPNELKMIFERLRVMGINYVLCAAYTPDEHTVRNQGALEVYNSVGLVSEFPELAPYVVSALGQSAWTSLKGALKEEKTDETSN